MPASGLMMARQNCSSLTPPAAYLPTPPLTAMRHLDQSSEVTCLNPKDSSEVLIQCLRLALVMRHDLTSSLKREDTTTK